ncbi:MAG: hypothetical protein ABSG94_06105, partial [Brevinematales bacterium]
AQAESNAIKYVAETLAPSEGSPLTYLLGQEYIKSLTKLGDSPNSKFLVMPADILETIGNVFKDKLGK